MWPSCKEFCPVDLAVGSGRNNQRLAMSLTVVLVLFLAQWERVRGCSPMVGGEPSLVEKIHHSQAVWHGKILKTYYDPHNYGAGLSVYNAEMAIFCIIKGPKVPRVTNVTRVGTIPGLCHVSNLEVGKNYIVMLHRSEGEFQITDTEVHPTEDNLNKVFSACGLEPRYPLGAVDQNGDETCHQLVTPCIADEHASDFMTNHTAPAIGEPYDPDHTRPLPPGHSDGDGHNHEGHYPGDGHEHGEHFEGDGHDHLHDNHYVGDGHDHTTETPEHYDGDGHDHDHHDSHGKNGEPADNVASEPQSGTPGVANSRYYLFTLFIASLLTYFIPRTLSM